MDVAAQIAPIGDATIARHDQVGLVERLLVIERHDNERQAIPVLDEGEAADPCRVELAGEQEGRDLLIGATLDQIDRLAQRFFQIDLHLVQQRDVRIEKDRSQPEPERRGRRGLARSKERCRKRGLEDRPSCQPPHGSGPVEDTEHVRQARP